MLTIPRLRGAPMLNLKSCGSFLKNIFSLRWMAGSEERLDLHQAAGQGNLEWLRELLSQEHPLHLQNFLGNTPLHLAARHRHVDCIQALLDHGADPNLMNLEGNSPLHFFFFMGGTQTLSHRHFLEELIAAGADPFARNKRGRSPADLTSSTDQALMDQAIRRMHESQALLDLARHHSVSIRERARL